MNDIAERPNAIATTGSIDPYAAYGAKAGTVGGQYLSFKNGEWLYGQNASVLPIGTKLAANMAGLRVGWRKWRDGKLEDDLTTLLVEGHPLEGRSTLGDTDEGLWEHGSDGKVRDPWVRTNILELVDTAGQAFQYSTSSKGGINAIAGLCTEYAKLYRQKPGLTPIVAISNDFYIHPEFGKTYVPKFEIVAWADADTLEEPEDLPGLEPPAVPAARAVPQPAGKKVPRF